MTTMEEKSQLTKQKDAYKLGFWSNYIESNQGLFSSLIAEAFFIG